MRDKIWMIGLFFLLMATLPLTILYKNSGTSGEEISNYDKAGNSAALDVEIRQAASLCRDDFCDEALRAVVILQKTNAAVSFDQKQAGADADAALTARVKFIYYSEEEILTLGGKPAAVPCCPSTNGCTEASQTYPYLRAVASPWDAFCAYRDSGQACVGVSLNGLDWLCRHGLSAEEALLWYLPGMEISS